jgi:hypothetical protein
VGVDTTHCMIEQGFAVFFLDMTARKHSEIS